MIVVFTSTILPTNVKIHSLNVLAQIEGMDPAHTKTNK